MDEEKRNELVLNNINLVYIVLQKLHLYHRKEDYYDVGIIGLLDAAREFDPDKGYTFSTFATACIRNRILRTIRSEKKYVKDISIYEKIIVGKDEKELIDTLDSGFDIEEQYIEKEEKRLLNEAISKLDEDEQQLIKCYYNDERKMTQEELAAIYNKSQSIMSRKIKRIIIKLRKYMEGRKYDYQL